MANPQNIEKHKFPKGQTGNPNGRPRKLPELDKLLADVLGEEKDGVSAAEAILKALRLKASKGDVRAIELMLDRAYGKAPQTITHEGLPTSVTFNFTDMSGDKTNEDELL